MKTWNTIAIIVYIQIFLIFLKIWGLSSIRWLWILAPTWGSIVILGFMIAFIGCVIVDVDKKR
jgi:hypothetical protein